MERSKEPDLRALCRVLAEAGVSYAVIGGVALQVHQREPRTTLDIDVGVPDRSALPRASLLTAGFVEGGRFPHSDNWEGPGGTPIQFTDDPALREALGRAITVPLQDTVVRVIGVSDLVAAKLRAARDAGRRRSKRLQDLADVQGLIEQDPTLEASLSEDERRFLRGLP